MACGNNRHSTIATQVVISLGSNLRGQPCCLSTSDTEVRLESFEHLLLVEPESFRVTIRRPNPEAGFRMEVHIGESCVIPLPEIDANHPRRPLRGHRGVRGAAQPFFLQSIPMALNAPSVLGL